MVGNQSNIVAGSCCAICCGVCFLVIGLPLLIAGVVLVQIRKGEYDDIQSIDEIYSDFPEFREDEIKTMLYRVGIGMIVVSVVFMVIGVVMVVLLCTGCCRKNQMSSNQGTVLNIHQQTTYPVQQSTYSINQGYYPNQPVVYGDVQQQIPPKGSLPSQQPYITQSYPQKA